MPHQNAPVTPKVRMGYLQHVVSKIVESLGVCTIAFRGPVTLVVASVHRPTHLCQRSSDMLVAAAVFSKSVHKYDTAAR